MKALPTLVIGLAAYWHTAVAFHAALPSLLRARAPGGTSISMAIDASRIKAISLDVTGTILVHRDPIMETYAAAAVWAQLPNPPTVEELKPAFKKAYYKHNTDSPCFGHAEGLSSRQWWVRTVRSVLELCGRDNYTDAEFDRFFRRVYQHYGSLQGYERLPDAQDFLDWAMTDSSFTMGITSNTPMRTMETVLPMTGHMDYFKWYVCSQDVGVEKPGAEIFERAYQEAQFWLGPLDKDQILHIGDSLAGDYCGAKAFGFQALHLDRSENARVTVYQDWLEAPDYPGKSQQDIRDNTITDLSQLRALLTAAPPAAKASSAAPEDVIPPAKREYMARLEFQRRRREEAEEAERRRQQSAAKAAPQPPASPPEASATPPANPTAPALPLDINVDTGAYNDANEVDRTGMEGHVTKVGEQISKVPGAEKIVRGELIDTATAESDVSEEVWQAEYIRQFGVPPPKEKLYDDETRAMSGWYDGEIDRQEQLQRAKESGWFDDDQLQSLSSSRPVPASAQGGDDKALADPLARFMRDQQRYIRAPGTPGFAAAAASNKDMPPVPTEPAAAPPPPARPSSHPYDFAAPARKDAPTSRRFAGVASSSSMAGADESLQSPAAVATPEVQVDDDDMSEQARFLRMRQGLSSKGLVRGAEATQASLPATASGSATLSRVTIHHEPPKKKEYKYEVRSNRGRVEEQFADKGDAGEGMAF